MSTRILHTADLHLGKKLHGFDLSDQQSSFISWLKVFISAEKINYLLISGDVFDLANPSSESMKMYYEMLKDISGLGCKMIITGGNHDSAALLNAPAGLLKAFDITVIGSAPEEHSQCLIPLQDNEKTSAVMAAVPYLRDTDIRKSVAGESYHDKLKAVKEGIKAYYDAAATLCEQKFPGVPAIAAGHLYAAGAEGSESEREIQIGNLAGIDAGTFSETFRYVALGHIHKPQQVGSQNRIFYSGSPYPLSFSEREQKKFVRVIDVKDGSISSRQVEAPQFRKLLRFSGTLESVRDLLAAYVHTGIHPSLAEIEIREENFDTRILTLKEDLVSEVNERPDIKIIFSKVEFFNQPFIDNEVIKEEEDLTPHTIFKNLIKDLPEDQGMELMVAFSELTEALNGGRES